MFARITRLEFKLANPSTILPFLQCSIALFVTEGNFDGDMTWLPDVKLREEKRVQQYAREVVMAQIHTNGSRSYFLGLWQEVLQKPKCETKM